MSRDQLLLRFHYFSKEQAKENLPDPRGSFRSKIIPSTITAANTEVMCVMNSSKLRFPELTGRKERLTTSIEFKAKVARS